MNQLIRPVPSPGKQAPGHSCGFASAIEEMRRMPKLLAALQAATGGTPEFDHYQRMPGLHLRVQHQQTPSTRQ